MSRAAPVDVGELVGYDVDSVRGFLPPADPTTSLPGRFARWDEIAGRFPALLAAKEFRRIIDGMPELPVGELSDRRDLERAKLLLSFFAHGYVWESAPAARRLPRQLARPLWELAERLGRLPIVAHASIALVNWRRIDPDGGIALGNLDSLITFTGTADEKWFYLLTTALEFVGGGAIEPILAAQRAVATRDEAGLAAALSAVAANIEAVSRVLDRMYEQCAPAVFYGQIRPWLSGWPEPGLVYEGTGTEAPQRIAGGSAAQSPLIQAYDALLGIAHPSPASGPFLLEMRRYMSPTHRAFLERLELGPSVRAFLEGRPESAAETAYNGCVEQLDRFRKSHLAMAGRYITKEAKSDEALVGTGGSDFGAFLGAARRETQAAKRGGEPPAGSRR